MGRTSSKANTEMPDRPGREISAGEGGYRIQENICALRRNSVNAVVLTANVARIYAQGTRLDPCTKSLSERSRYGAVALYKHFEHLSSLLIRKEESAQ